MREGCVVEGITAAINFVNLLVAFCIKLFKLTKVLEIPKADNRPVTEGPRAGLATGVEGCGGAIL